MTLNACYKTCLFLLFLQPLHAEAQRRFINRIDSNFVANALFANGESTGCDGSATLNPYDIDYDLLNCLVMAEINAYRKKRHLPAVHYSHKLDLLAQNYLNYFNRSTFIDHQKNRIKVNYPLKRAAKKLDYRNGIISSIIYQAELVVAEKKLGVFYSEEPNNDPLNLFYGPQPTKQQLRDGYIFDPVKPTTYIDFAQYFFKTKILRSYSRQLNDKAMRQVGCRSLVIQQSLHKHQLPAANFMIVMGAPRLELLYPSAK